MELALSVSEHSRIGLPGHGSPENGSAKQSPVQLDLLPYTSDYSHASQLWLSLAPENGNNSENSSSGQMVSFDVNEIPSDRTDEATVSSPNSHTMNGKRDWESETETERASSRCSDEEGGLNRKKLRLSKDQSTYLEETFKQHNTLNPKQKVGLAKLLNLRPRQVEVWFQNRRARTKFKQTEVDREYLKRCCESLTKENRRLQKELVELKALKSATPSYRLQPATTLTICASCERAATTATGNIGNSGSLRVPKPCFIQFP